MESTSDSEKNLKITYLNQLNDQRRDWQWYCRFFCRHHLECWSLREEMRPRRYYMHKTWVRCYYSKSNDAQMFYARVISPELHKEEYLKNLQEIKKLDEYKANIIEIFVKTLCISNITFPYPRIKTKTNGNTDLIWKWKNGWSLRVGFSKDNENLKYLGYIDPRNTLLRKAIERFKGFYSTDEEKRQRWNPDIVICGNQEAFKVIWKIITWFREYQRIECASIVEVIDKFHTKIREERYLRSILTSKEGSSIKRYKVSKGRRDIVTRVAFCHHCPQCGQQWLPLVGQRVTSDIIIKEEVCPLCKLNDFEKDEFVHLMRKAESGTIPDHSLRPLFRIITDIAIASDCNLFLDEVNTLDNVLIMSELCDTPLFFHVINLLANRILAIYKNLLIEIHNRTFG